MFIATHVWATFTPLGKWLALAAGYRPDPVHTRRARAARTR